MGNMTEQEILQKMRERVLREKGSDHGTDLSSFLLNGMSMWVAPELQELGSQVSEIHARSLLVGNVNPRRPGLHNDAIQLVKKALRRCFTWYIRPAHEFNFALVAFLQQLVAGFLQKLVQQVTTMHYDLNSQLEQLRAAHNRLEAEFKEVNRVHIFETLRHQEAALRRLEYQMAKASTSGGNARPATSKGAVQPARLETALPLNFEYSRFQERYRGSEELIKKRQRAYLKFFLGRSMVMDVGCGRGEFLELLREHDISGIGVDSRLDAVLLCKEKGLEVVQADLFEKLESTADASLGGVFCSQVIEHLPVEMQLRMIDLCHQKTKTGSPVLIETVNPECVFALVRNFFIDPTHIRPVPPELLQFAVESKGFNNVQVIFSGPVEGKHLERFTAAQIPELQEMKEAILVMNHFLFGHQDYAVVGWRE